MKKFEWPLVIGPRVVTMQNPKQSFDGFLRVVQNVVSGQRLFVSKQIFTEVWDDCIKRGGKIAAPLKKDNFLVYAFTSGHIEDNTSLRFVFFVHLYAKPNLQIELVKAAGFGLNFQGGYNSIGEKFYFQRAPKKSLENEK